MALTLLKPAHDVWKPGEHNGTFRGNCHAFITAAAALDTFWADDAFAAEVRRKGQYLGDRLAEIAARNSRIAEGVKGRGMMRGLDVGGAEASSRIVQAAFAQGLIIETSGARDEVVKVLAPLTISDADLAHGLDILAAAVANASAHAAGKTSA